MSERASQRVAVLDPLRGIAALAVTWFHFTNGRHGYLPSGYVKTSGAYGWLGVEVFFVISGFVIPYALRGAGYRVEWMARFILKRVMRLDPPYSCTIALTIIIAAIAARRHGSPLQITATQVLLHVGYLNVFTGHAWLDDAFWTLAVEFQHYLLIGVIFPLVASAAGTTRGLAMVGLAALAFAFPAEAFVFRYMFLFLFGICTFQLRVGLVSRRGYLMLLPLLTAGVWITLGAPDAAVALGTALTIAFLEGRGARSLRGLGLLSYSLYLLHGPIGGGVLIQAERMTRSTGVRLGAILVAGAASLVAATLMYWLGERPSRRWSAALPLAVGVEPPTVGVALAAGGP